MILTKIWEYCRAGKKNLVMVYLLYLSESIFISLLEMKYWGHKLPALGFTIAVINWFMAKNDKIRAHYHLLITVHIISMFLIANGVILKESIYVRWGVFLFLSLYYLINNFTIFHFMWIGVFLIQLTPFEKYTYLLYIPWYNIVVIRGFIYLLRDIPLRKLKISLRIVDYGNANTESGSYTIF